MNPGKSSFPIGLVNDAEYYDTRVELADDFAIFLFSDGILEHMNDGSMADKEERLLEVITQYKGDFTQVKTALDLHEDIKVPDDIAVLSVTGT
jgi:serine phosphatase RsbU (regulator of sigma subunit)